MYERTFTYMYITDDLEINNKATKIRYNIFGPLEKFKTNTCMYLYDISKIISNIGMYTYLIIKIITNDSIVNRKKLKQRKTESVI